MAVDAARLEALFAEAAAMPAAERGPCLDRACGDDPELRQRVEALLTAHDGVGAFLELPTAPPGERPGYMIGRYKLLEQIGEGGFGVVFMAEQREPVRRLVALKIIKLGMDTKQVVARFEAERQALALMDHPNVAKVLDGGATDAGRPYFVMELVRGVPITTFCDENKLTTHQRLELFIPVCSALQHAHQKGIIHRDLKPGNVLVTMHDDKPVPKIIDFGVAKAINQRLTEHTLFTEFRQLIGTPAYMSPEQAQMSGLDVDTRSDIYSLGVLLYELLTGATPFDAQELRSAAYAEMQRIIREVEPPPPSTRVSTLAAGALTGVADRRRCDPGALSRVIRGELDWIVMKCLEKDRSRRYETAGALSRDLRRHLSDEPVEASPPSATYRLRKLLRKHRGEAIGVGAVMAALVLGIIGTAIGLAQARHNLSTARDAERRLKSQKDLADAVALQARQAEQKEAAERRQADAVTDRLEAILHHLDPYAEEKGGQDLRTQLHSELDSLATDLQNNSHQDPHMRARLLDSVGWTQLHLGEIAKAEKLLESAVSIIRSEGGPSDSRGSSAMYHLALAWQQAGRASESVKLLEEVHGWQEANLGPDHSDTLLTMEGLVDVYETLGRTVDSENVRDRLIARSSNIPGSNDSLKIKEVLADRYAFAERVDEAIKIRERLREARIASLGPDNALTLNSSRDLAGSYWRAGRAKDAIALLEDTRDRQVKMLGPDHSEVLLTLCELGLAYGAANRNGDEVALFETLRRRYTDQFGPQHPWTLTVLDNLALAYLQVGREEDGLKLFQEVVDLRVRLLGPDNPHTLLSKYNLTRALRNVGRTADGIRLLEEVRERQLAKLGPDHPDLLRTLGQLGMFYQETGRAPEGVKLLEEVRGRMIKNFGPDHPHTLATTFNLALAYDSIHRTSDAIRMYSEVRDRTSNTKMADNDLRAAAFYGLGADYRNVGRTGDAVKLFEQLRDELMVAFGPDDPRTGAAWYQLGQTYRSQQRSKEARVALLAARSGMLNRFRDGTDQLSHVAGPAWGYAWRGELFALLGEFREAAEDYAKAVELKPDKIEYWHDGLMPLLLQMGREDEFRRRIGDEIRQFRNTTDPFIAHKVAKDVLIIPVAPGNLKIATEMADRALASTKDDWPKCQSKGMSEYRNGNYAQAIRWFSKTKQFPDSVYCHTIADLFLAMSYERLGDHFHAEESLGRACRKMQTTFPKPEEGELVEWFQDWIFCNVLRREAEEVVRDKAKTSRPAASTRPMASN